MPRIGPKQDFESLEQWCVANDATNWLKLWAHERNTYTPAELDKRSAEQVWLRVVFDEDGKIVWDLDKLPDDATVTMGYWQTRPTEIAREFHADRLSIPYLSPKKQWGLHGFNSLETKYPELAVEYDEERNAEQCLAPNGQPANVFNVPYNCKTEYWWTRYYEVDGQVVPVSWQQSVASRVKEIDRGHDEQMLRNEKEMESFMSEDMLDGFDMSEIAQICYSQLPEPEVAKCHYSAPKIFADGKDDHFIPLMRGVNDLMSTHPLMAYEIDYEKNAAEGIDTTKIHKDMTEEIWWKGPSGKSWKASPSKRLAGRAQSPFHKSHTSYPEQAIFYYIKQRFPDAVNGDRKQLDGRKELDIYIPSLKLAIEYDGERWHTDLARDIKKNELCEENGIRLIRIREANCPDLPTSTGWETISLEDSSTKELNRAVRTIFGWLNIRDVDVDINARKNEIKDLYMPEVNKNYIGGHLLLKGSEIRKLIDPQEAALVKHVKFVNVDEMPPDEKVPGGAKYKLSEDNRAVKCSDGVYRDKIAGWREGDTFYIATGDNTKIYVNGDCYDILLAFPNLKSVELQNVAEKTGNDVRQLLYGVRNRPKVKILGYDVQSLDLYGKKVPFVSREEYEGHNIYSVKDGYLSRTVKPTMGPLEHMAIRAIQYELGEYAETEQLRVARAREVLKNKDKSRGPQLKSSQYADKEISHKKKNADLER